MVQSAAPSPAPDVLHREFWTERIQSARRINLLRFCGVSAFFALFLVLGGILQLPAWTGNLGFFTIFWVATAAVYWASRRFESVAGLATLAIALVDIPMVFLLQWATFPMMPAMSGMDVHDEVRRVAPGQAARMIFLTGGAFTPRAERFLVDMSDGRTSDL
jgi:hypothetical protein